MDGCVQLVIRSVLQSDYSVGSRCARRNPLRFSSTEIVVETEWQAGMIVACGAWSERAAVGGVFCSAALRRVEALIYLRFRFFSLDTIARRHGNLAFGIVKITFENVIFTLGLTSPRPD